MPQATDPVPLPAVNDPAACVSDSPLCFRSVSLSFGPRTLLDAISFTLRPGETRILLGLAGMGKSTLLKLANGLIRPDSGEIFLFGQPIASMPEPALLDLRRRTGMVFQESALFDSLTVRDNVGWQLIERGISGETIDRRVHRALSFVDLDHAFSLFPPSLSGGMRRRVSIARAIIDKPDLILYDSPTGGLDPVTSTTILELIVKQRDEYRTPSLMVTHRLQDAFMLLNHRYDADQQRMVALPDGATDPNTTFLMLNEGRMIFDGSIHQLVTSKDPFVCEFLA